jgi:hypothetical protein
MFRDIGAVRNAMGRVKSRFIRALVESVQQETGGTALARLRSGLPPYLLRVLSRDVLGLPDRDASMDVDASIELLLAIDRVLCGGSGVVMARATAGLAARVLSQSEGLVVPGDTVATLQHLRAPFEHPFIDVDVRYSARRNSEGFVFELELLGHPRAAQWLIAAGLGYARTAAKFSGQSSGPLLRFDTTIVGDQARIFARKGESGTLSLERELQSSREDRSRLAQRRRSSPTNAAAQVDEILGRGSAPGSPARSGDAELHLAKTRPEQSDGSPEFSGAASGTRPKAQSAPPPPHVRKNVS